MSRRSDKGEGEAGSVRCPLAHDWRDADAVPTPGCSMCEDRRRKLERIEALRQENAGAHREAVRRGLLDVDEV